MRAAIYAWRFLIKTRNLALKASALTNYNTRYYIPGPTPDSSVKSELIFFGASDASFADDSSTRASSDSYL
jgi:hypothetical protein